MLKLLEEVEQGQSQLQQVQQEADKRQDTDAALGAANSMPSKLLDMEKIVKALEVNERTE